MAYARDVLFELLSMPSPTGYTDQIVHRVCDRLTTLGLGFEITRRGAIRVEIEGRQPNPARAIVAHLDTLGAQVKYPKENGRLSIVPLGHWSARFAEGARVTIFTRQGMHPGTHLTLNASGPTFNVESDTPPVARTHLDLPA